MVFAKYMESPKYKIYIIASILALLFLSLGVGAWFIYGYYVNKKEQNVTAQFAQIIEEYNQNLPNNSDLYEAITAVAEKYKNSQLYPFFLAYKSSLLLKPNYKSESQENKSSEKEAIELLDNMVSALNAKDPLYYPYAIKKALLKLDSKFSDLSNQGYSELKNLSNDVNNPLQDMATYDLALYELSKANKAEAKNLFEVIVLKNRQSSPWYSMSKSRLESL